MSNHTTSHQATITAITHEGRGVATINGKKVFIDGALSGEIVNFVYHKRHAQFDEGYATEIIQASFERATPKCKHYGQCGGCSLQHMNTTAQMAMKQKILEEQLQHIAKVTPNQWLSPILGPSWNYRNKARLGVRYVRKKEEMLIGFREKYKPGFIAHMQQCEIMHPHVVETLPVLKALLQSLSNKEQIAQIEVAAGDDATALIIRHLSPFLDDEIQQLIDYAEHHKIHLYLQPGSLTSIHRIWPQDGPEVLQYHLPNFNLTLQFHPSDFTQINPSINQLMVQQALTLLAPEPSDDILDLFCGLGNFTLPIAQHCRYSLGVEGDDKMVQRARSNAKLNNIHNADFFCSNLMDDCDINAWPKQRFNKILLDPPRTGALNIVSRIDDFDAKRIVYVSCNPATLARDCYELVHKHGYQLKAAGVMDMFPHTQHVESIALFEK